MKIKFTLVALLTLATSSIMAQFSLSGEFRPRTEYFGNGGNFTVEPGTLPSTTAVEGQEGFISTSARVAIKATYKAELTHCSLVYKKYFYSEIVSKFLLLVMET